MESRSIEANRDDAGSKVNLTELFTVLASNEKFSDKNSKVVTRGFSIPQQKVKVPAGSASMRRTFFPYSADATPIE